MDEKKITLEVTERELLILHGSVLHINMHRHPQVNCQGFGFAYMLSMNHDELTHLVNNIEKTYKEQHVDVYPFTAIKELIASTEIGGEITRQQLIKSLRVKCGVTFSESTMDSIRRYFTAAGYLQDVQTDDKRWYGIYKVVRHPDVKLTKSQLLKEAYETR